MVPAAAFWASENAGGVMRKKHIPKPILTCSMPKEIGEGLFSFSISLHMM
jgi:hypothetical protein